MTKPRIFVIESRAARAPYGGVARYIREMLNGLQARYGNELIVCSSLNDLPASIRRVRLPLRYPWRYSSQFLYEVTNFWEKRLLAGVERRFKPDVVFSPLFGPLAQTRPQVFTVYDLRLELYPEHYNEKKRLLEVEHRRRCFHKAAAISCISDATRNDLLHFYPDLDPHKVHVVLLGVSERFLHVPKLENNGRPYFLFVGNRNGPKNFIRLLEAFAMSGLARAYDLRAISPGLELSDRWSDPEQQVIRSRGLEESVKLTVKASESELAEAYAGASGFIFPSEHEGFGLPVLEALAAGTIVATSNRSSLPEAGGDAALYFDPSNVEDISKSLLQIAQMNSTDRALRVKAGREHAKSLSWEKCVDKTCALLEAAAVAINN